MKRWRLVVREATPVAAQLLPRDNHGPPLDSGATPVSP